MASGALDDHAPEDLLCESEVFDIDFHPQLDMLALGTVSGVVQVYKYAEDASHKVLELRPQTDAVRALLFAPDGQSASCWRWCGQVRLRC